jgi:hypothetical protein
MRISAPNLIFELRAQWEPYESCGLISGRKRDLLSFSKIQSQLCLGGPAYRGVQAVPLAKIVGSVDRY